MNAVAVKKLGFETQEIVGKHLYNENSSGRSTYEVIGVMEDYHQVTLKEEIYPLLFRVTASESNHDSMMLDITEKNFGKLWRFWKTHLATDNHKTVL